MADAKKKTTTGTPVKPIDNVEVRWLGKDKFHKAGDTSMLHKVQAKKMRDLGLIEVVTGGKTEQSKEFEKA